MLQKLFVSFTDRPAYFQGLIFLAVRFWRAGPPTSRGIDIPGREILAGRLGFKNKRHQFQNDQLGM